MVGIALRPTKNCSDRLVGTHRELAKTLGAEFLLDAENCIPHLSLVHVPEVAMSEGVTSAFTSLGETLRQTLDQHIGSRLLSLESSGITYVSKGWFFLDFVTSQVVQAMHDASFAAMRPFFVPGRTPLSELSHYSPRERENYRRFGYRYIGEQYDPHITLLRSQSASSLGAERAREILTSYKLDRLEFDEVFLFEIGPHGTTASIKKTHRFRDCSG